MEHRTLGSCFETVEAVLSFCSKMRDFSSDLSHHRGSWPTVRNSPGRNPLGENERQFARILATVGLKKMSGGGHVPRLAAVNCQAYLNISGGEWRTVYMSLFLLCLLTSINMNHCKACSKQRRYPRNAGVELLTE